MDQRVRNKVPLYSKVFFVAIVAEVLLISAGLGVAFTQGLASFEKHQNTSLALSAAGFPLLLATLELFKIPAGIMLYKVQWFLKPVALIFLIAGMTATFETTVMTGSTWFRSIQFQVTAAQDELTSLQEDIRFRQSGDGEPVEDIRKIIADLDTQISNLERGSAFVVAAKERVERLESDLEEARTLRTRIREQFRDERRDLEDHLSKRIERGGADGEEARKSLRSLLGEQQYLDRKMADWDANEGEINKNNIQGLESEYINAQEDLDKRQEQEAKNYEDQLYELRKQRATLSDQLNIAILTSAQNVEDTSKLKRDIILKQKEISQLSSESLIYDIASKVYSKPAREVTEAEANEITFWVIGGAAVAISAATGIAAMLATHLQHQNPNPKLTLAQSIRRYVVTRRFKRKKTVINEVEKPIETTRYKWFPQPQDIANFDQPVMRDLFEK